MEGRNPPAYQFITGTTNTLAVFETKIFSFSVLEFVVKICRIGSNCWEMDPNGLFHHLYLTYYGTNDWWGWGGVVFSDERQQMCLL